MGKEIHVPESNGAGKNQLPQFDAHILLVEDNPVNRDIGVAILEGFGCTVECADDGLVGVRAAEEKRFDLILMDCQMPNMDGFAATKEIRMHEAQMQAATPGAAPSRYTIVAVTANAMLGDRERCLEAGMDDYLSKPFGRDQLAECLGRWLRPQGSAPCSIEAAPSHEAPLEPPAHGDAAQTPLDTTSHTRPAFDAEVLKGVLPPGTKVESMLARRFLNVFAAEATRLVAEIERACSAGDCEAAARAAHSLKSSAGSLGAMAIYMLARELEADARIGQAASLAGYAASLRRELERFLDDPTVQRLTAHVGMAAA